MNWTDIQKILKSKGFDPGPIDGIPGRQTIAAVKAFQRFTGLEVDGVVGPITLDALLKNPGDGTPRPRPSFDDVPMPPWMVLLGTKMGLHEIRDNAKLKAFLKSDGSTLGDPARLPWCGDLVETVIAVSLPDETLPGDPYRAKAWAGFGKKSEPAFGAVAVFTRPGGGHVGFLVGERKDALRIRGGNQGNSICDTWILKSRLLDIRKPVTYRPSLPPLPDKDDSGAVSENEL